MDCCGRPGVSDGCRSAWCSPLQMRQPNPKEVRRQIRDVFTGAGLLGLGFVVMLVLYRSTRFADWLQSEYRGERHLAISLTVGLGVTMLLMCAWLWVAARRKGC